MTAKQFSWVYLITAVLWSALGRGESTDILSPTPTALQKAIQNAAPGDTICVYSADIQLDSTLMISKPLTLIACERVILRAPEASGIFEIRADGVEINGFELKDVDRSYIKDLAAIWIDFSKDFKIINNTIEDSFFGIMATKSSKGIISGNKIRGNAVDEHSSANAIHLWYCKNLSIENNSVSHHRDGIYLEFTDSSEVRNNLSEHNLRYGLHFMFSNDDIYANNTFRQNGSGVAVMFSDHIDMVENVFIENWGSAAYGLLLKEIYDSRLIGNEFVQNTIGIFAEGASRVEISRNVFRENGWGIKMRGSAMDNQITKNNFSGNSFHVASDAKTNYNRYSENYWDNYSGYDLDKDGFGDIPHRPVSVFSYMVTRVDESIILLRSSFIQVLEFAERVTPALTPTDLEDGKPVMKPYEI